MSRSRTAQYAVSKLWQEHISVDREHRPRPREAFEPIRWYNNIRNMGGKDEEVENTARDLPSDDIGAGI